MTRWPTLTRRTTALSLAILSLLLTNAAVALAGGPIVTVERVDSEAFPQVTAYFTVASDRGLPLTDLRAADLTILEDGVPVAAESVVLEGETADRGLSLVLGLDCATTFEVLAKVRAAAESFVDSLGPRDQVAIIAYSSEVVVLQDFTGDQARLKAAIGTMMTVGDKTAFNKAAAQAVSLLAPLPSGPKAVMMVTDSGDTVSALAAQQTIADAQAARVPIYTVGFGTGVNPVLIADMADQTGGTSAVVAAAEDVPGALQSMASGLRHVYKVTFKSGLKPDNAQHRLSIGVTHRGSQGQAESGFVAVTNQLITIAVPATDGQTVEGTVDLTAQVTAPAPPVASVEYKLDGQPLTQLFAPPFEFRWDTTTVAPGPHLLTVTAFDQGGNQGQIQLTLTVVAPQPLVVSASTAQEKVNLGDPVTVEAAVDTSTPVDRVDFLLDGRLIGSDYAPPYAFTFDSGEYQAGEHTVTVRAVDSLGRKAEARLDFQFSNTITLAMLRQVGVRLGVIAVIFLVVAVTIILMIAIMRSLRVVSQSGCRVEVSNLGNARSRFALQADDPGGVLKFHFILNGVDLPLLPGDGVAGPEAAPAAALEETAIAAGDGREPAQEPQREARPSKGPAGASKAADVKQAAGKASGLAYTVADLLSSVGYLLPRSIGAPLLNTAARMRETQRQAQYMAQPTALERAQRLAGKADAPRAAAPLPSAAPAQTQASLAAAPAGVSAGPSPAAPSAAARAAAQREVPRPGASTGPSWSLTPPVEAGETLTIHLRVRLLRQAQTQRYSFRVASRAVDHDASGMVVEHGSITIEEVPWIRRALPWIISLVMVTAAALVVIFLTAFLLTGLAGLA